MSVQSPSVRVLLVEDSPTTARVIEAMLIGAGSEFLVDKAASLGEARKLLPATHYDLVLLDLNLPDSNGLETFERAAEITATPIVVLTGLDDEMLALRAIEAGAQDYLVKGSVSGASLARSLRYAVQRHRSGSDDDGDRRVAEILSSASHELRRPLSIITGYADVLQKGKITSPELIEEAYASIRGASERASQLVELLMDAGRISAGQVRPTITRCEVAATIARAVADLPAEGRLAVDVPDSIGEIETDVHIVQDALINLVENALQYSDGRVWIDAERTAEGVRISVRDEGPGMTPADQDRIFEPFFRAPSQLKPGTGLGLYLVRLTIGSVGGTVEVDSQEGKGCTFRMDLPAGTGESS